MKKLLSLLLVLPVCAGAATLLKLPEGFHPVSASTDRGNALFSQQAIAIWQQENGAGVRLWLDDSNRISNEKVAGYAASMVEQMAEQAKADFEIGDSFRHNVGGKNWVVTPFVSRHPETKPDIMILLTEFDRSLALIQVAAMRPQRAALKAAWPQVIRLNSPAGSK